MKRSKFGVIVFYAVLMCLFCAAPVWAEDTVVTISFAGTGLTEEWWDPNQAVGAFGFGFFTRESVATLHKLQKESETHKKKFINGIGTDCSQQTIWNFLDVLIGLPVVGFIQDFLDLAQQGAPSWEALGCRGWETSMQEAENYLRSILPPAPEKVVLNLVGLSRGGVLTMRFANRVYGKADLKNRIDRINILAFEPVAGDTSLPPSEFVLNDLVSQYVGMYAVDERAALFSPAIPDFVSPGTQYWMFTVPGSHETLVGNIQSDGHHSSLNEFPCFWLAPPLHSRFGQCFDDDLLRVSWVTTFIAEKLLGSSQWGNVEFDMDQLDGIWHAGLNDENSEEIFIEKVDGLWTYEFSTFWGTAVYETMRRYTVSEFIGFESCEAGPPLIFTYYAYLDWFFFKGYENERCVDQYISTGGGNGVWQRSTFQKLQQEGLVDALDDGEMALAILQELGNSAPVGDANGPYVGDEGLQIIFNASGSTDPDDDPLKYRWDFDDDGVWDTAWSSSSTANHTWGDDHTGTVRVEVSDGRLTNDAYTDVTIHNVNPSTQIDFVDQPNLHFILPVVHTLMFHGSFTDAGWLDTHTSTWDFGDGSVVLGTLIEETIEPDSTGNSTADHSYAMPGDFPVILHIRDDDGGTGADTITVTVATATQANEVINSYIQNLPESIFKNNAKQRKSALSNKMREIDKMIDSGMYAAAIDKLRHDVRAKADGYVDGKLNNDWIRDPESQEEICIMIDDLTAYLESL